jgi:hypothetical protein
VGEVQSVGSACDVGYITRSVVYFNTLWHMQKYVMRISNVASLTIFNIRFKCVSVLAGSKISTTKRPVRNRCRVIQYVNLKYIPVKGRYK